MKPDGAQVLPCPSCIIPKLCLVGTRVISGDEQSSQSAVSVKEEKSNHLIGVGKILLPHFMRHDGRAEGLRASDLINPTRMMRRAHGRNRCVP
jgi:hypothetical protein